MAGRVCPVWVGYIMASPLRRLMENPMKILGDFIEPGMTVLDVGCAMGFFSLPAAKLVGSNGKAVCVDLQSGMIESLKKRAARSGLSDRIDPRICSENSLEISDLVDQVDFAFAFHVVHEVPDVPGFMAEIHTVLKPGARFLVAEPKGHTSVDDYKATEAAAQQAGFMIIDQPKLRKDRTTMFLKK